MENETKKWKTMRIADENEEQAGRETGELETKLEILTVNNDTEENRLIITIKRCGFKLKLGNGQIRNEADTLTFATV